MYILGIYLDSSAVGHYRVSQPLNKVMEQGLAHVHLFSYREHGHDWERLAECISLADVVLMPRPHNEKFFEIIKAVQSQGKILIIDHDDDVFNLNPMNPYYKYIGVKEVMLMNDDGTPQKDEEGDPIYLWHDGMMNQSGTKVLFDIEKNMRTRDMIRSCLRNADAVSVTTDILAETFKIHNKKTFVFPNLIDLNLFQRYEMEKTEKVRILWQGGHSHFGDMYLIKDVMRRILEKNKNVTWVVFGSRFASILKDMPLGQIEEVDWVNHAAYPYKLSLLNCDIGIAPLEDNEFNRNKSSIKYLEYGAVGMPTVASNVSPYKEAIKDGENGYLASNDDDFVDKLQMLIDSKQSRDRMAERAYKDIQDKYCADKNAHLLVDSYNEIIKGDING